MESCYIFGSLPVKQMPKIPSDSFIIAADGGVKTLEKAGIKPDVVIGDFDSLGFVPTADNVIKLSVRKDDTDVGYALKYAMDKGFKNFFVYGAVGGLLDHTVANMQLCAAVSKKRCTAVFYGDDCNFTAVTGSGVSFSNAKGRISVFAVCGAAAGVTIKGLEYTLENAVLLPDMPLGVSNAFVSGETASVSVRMGTLLVVWQTAAEIKFN